MDSSKMVWIGAGIGSTVGGFVPILWGGDAFSFSGIIFSGVGAIVGIYVFFKMSQ